jgi:ribosomal protein S18 acetylase RimI-like enzyme
MPYSIKLVSEPDGVNERAINIVRQMDKEQFPGCEVTRLSESYVWLAYASNGEPVGYCSLRPLPNEKYGYLSRAAVKKEHRRRGLHKRLIRVRLNTARRIGLHGVLTYTAVDNIASINSLIKHGFQLYIPEYRWAGKEFLYLIRKF